MSTWQKLIPMPIDDYLRFLHEHSEIRGIALDSRAVRPGYLFIAVSGSGTDGRRFILDALRQGASTLLIEAPFTVPTDVTIPYLVVENLKKKLGSLAGEFYGHPSKQLSVIGVTGTNGKTSTCHFIAQLLNHKKQCGLIGTLGQGVLPRLQPLVNTTPSAVDIQYYLSEFLHKEHCQVVAMEVSSHALQQSRVDNIHFNTAIFTNLSHDHLDYHGNMENYWQAKRQLFFNDPVPKNMVINIEDPYGQRLFQALNQPQVFGYRLEQANTRSVELAGKHEIVGYLEASHNHGFVLRICSPWGKGIAECNLLGRFNASNLLAAISSACLEGMSFEEVLAALPTVQPVKGRMMCLGGQKNLPLVVIDFAHTPDALIKILMELRGHCKGKLWCIFGCGGDRDRTKRPLMARAAVQYSDRIIMTQDNSRTEDPKQIFSDMLAGCQSLDVVEIEYDRAQAIENAILAANPEDVVVVAGKGHEDYQWIGTEKIPYSDAIAVQKALAGRFL